MSKSRGKGGGTRFFGTAIVVLLKAVAVILTIATPLLGVWVSSSLAAYLNGPIWLTILTGLLFFPLLPLAWEGFVAWRRSRKAVNRDRILTFVDRMILRTLFLNLAFLAVLLFSRPEVGFTALQARGDWMLEGVEADWVDDTRPWIFGAADRLEWLYELANENPYAEENPDEGVVPDLPPPAPEAKSPPSKSPPSKSPPSKSPPSKGGGLTGRWGGSEGGGRDAGPSKVDDSTAPDASVSEGPLNRGGPDNRGTNFDGDSPQPRNARKLWPTTSTLHSVVATMPASAETSINGVADYIKSRVNAPDERIRAAHDWVVDRIAYDVAALDLPRIPPQDAEIIFRNRKGVCAGYARLLRTMGKRLGLDVVYVVGNGREEDGEVSGIGHAWNAVKINGGWHLIDATWNAGSVGRDAGGAREFTKRYSTRYFLAPPEVFGLNHFPDDPRWQLRRRPLSRGDFIRQPMLDPRFFMQKMGLLEPTRSQITVGRDMVIRVDNPDGWFMLASFRPLSGNTNTKTRCQTTNGPQVRFNCRFPGAGTWRVQMFSNRQRYGSFAYVGQVLVNSR